MWILLYRLRCSRNSALPYFHKIKLNFVLRSYSTRLTEIQFLSLLRSSPAHAKLPREHSGRSRPEVTAHAGSFWVSPCPTPTGSWILWVRWFLELRFYLPEWSRWSVPTSPPQGLPVTSWRCDGGAGHRSPYTQNPDLHRLLSLYPTFLPSLLSDTLMSCNNYLAVVAKVQAGQNCVLKEFRIFFIDYRPLI